MRQILPLFFHLTVFAQGSPSDAPLLRPSASLELGDRVLGSPASLLLTPDRTAVAVLDDAGVQLWDGRAGEVRKSTLRHKEDETAPFGGCGSSGPGTTYSAPPPPLWDGGREAFRVIAMDGARDVSMSGGQILHKRGAPESDAMGVACSLALEGMDQLCVRFEDGREWRMEPRGVRRILADLKPVERLLAGRSQFQCVALAPDGSRVAAIWNELEPTGYPSFPYRRGPSHLLVWRRNDRLPSLDLHWEGETPNAMDFTPSAERILVRLSSESIILDPDTGRERAVIPTQESPACWVPGQDKAVFLVDSGSKTYALWDLTWGEEAQRFRLPMQARPAPDGSDPESADEIPYLSGPEAISPDGRWIACTLRCPPGWEVSQILLFDLES